MFNLFKAMFITLFIGSGISSQHDFLRNRAVNSFSKAGLAWSNGDDVDIQQYGTTGKISWYYSWSAWPIRSPTNLEFVPMLWGPNTIDQFTSSVTSSSLMNLRTQVTSVLGMNEPDQPGQSNLTPQQGAQMWVKYIEPLRSSGFRLGSPAISSAPAGKTWLQNFFTACNGSCTVDFIALHWYGIDAGDFIAYLTDHHDTFKKNIWVTEWACQNYVDQNKQCSAEDVMQFMNRTQSFMDNTDFVERYAWFGAMRDLRGVNPYNALMDKNGVINSLGMQYIASSSTSSNSWATFSPRGNHILPSISIVASTIFIVQLDLVFDMIFKTFTSP